MNFSAAERPHKVPTLIPKLPDARDTVVDSLGMDNDFLDPNDVSVRPGTLPPDFEVAPYIPALDNSTLRPEQGPVPPPLPRTQLQSITSPVNAASHPTVFKDIENNRQTISGVRLRDGNAGKSIEELTAGSREYVAARTLLVDFVYSELFRQEGRDAIPDTVIDALEQFHRQPRADDAATKRHSQEMDELVQVLARVPEPTSNRVLHREGINELLDFVKDPFFFVMGSGGNVY